MLDISPLNISRANQNRSNSGEKIVTNPSADESKSRGRDEATRYASWSPQKSATRQDPQEVRHRIAELPARYHSIF